MTAIHIGKTGISLTVHLVAWKMKNNEEIPFTPALGVEEPLEMRTIDTEVKWTKTEEPAAKTLKFGLIWNYITTQ